MSRSLAHWRNFHLKTNQSNQIYYNGVKTRTDIWTFGCKSTQRVSLQPGWKLWVAVVWKMYMPASFKARYTVDIIICFTNRHRASDSQLQNCQCLSTSSYVHRTLFQILFKKFWSKITYQCIFQCTLKCLKYNAIKWNIRYTLKLLHWINIGISRYERSWPESLYQ